ncbi:MAG TPA: UdgX family uracil-DNA binding protein [Dongiaceae bacterium]|nr:UdgX family uracil-DNA binding protein [Dongiaceae bacterium]
MHETIERDSAMATKREPEAETVEPKSLAALNKLISAAEPLVPGADHAVLGEGPIGAEIAFVGEQPGDQEDRAGKPFVGPAGMLLNRAMEEAGIDRRHVYVTNAVKHFKFEQRGKKRIHQKPTMGEVKRYRWWLMKELDFVHPKLVVALGGTAAAALAGKAVSVTKARGGAEFDGRPGFITVHPSYLLRIPDEDAKAQAYKDFVRDLRRIHQMAA